MQFQFLEAKGYEFIDELKGLQFSHVHIARKNDDFLLIKTNANDEHFLNELRFAKSSVVSNHVLRPLRIEQDEQQNDSAIVYPILSNSLAAKFLLLTEAQKFKIVAEIALGVSDIHASGFFHGDVKLQNILSSVHGAVLCDFGTTRPLNETGVRALGAIANHQPPDSNWSYKIDIYALGVLLYQSLYGHDFLRDYVFNQMNFPDQSTVNIARGINDRMIELANGLIRAATRRRPEERCSLDYFRGMMNELQTVVA